MKYLLDTNVISDAVKGNASVLQALRSRRPQELAVSSITRMEIEYGLLINPLSAAKWRGVIDGFYRLLDVVPYAENEAVATAKIRAELKRIGKPVGNFDSLIAGTALAHKIVLVTANVSEFRQVAGLNLENWREGIQEGP